MPIDYSKVRLGFRSLLLNAQLDPNWPGDAAINWEGKPFKTPSPPAPWIRETLIPADERQVASASILGEGFLQYDCVVPEASGITAIEALSLLVRSQFPLGAFTHDGLSIYIDRVSPLGSMKVEDVWRVQPISIKFRAYVAI